MEQRMTMHPEDFDFPLTVRYGEIGFDGVATRPSLANWLQEAAGQSASSLGFGEETLAPLGLSWILARLALRIIRLPHAGEQLRVRTWPSALDRFGHRGYEVYDAREHLIVTGTSAWTIMNLNERRLAPIPMELAEVYPQKPRPCLPFCCRTLPRMAGEISAQGTLLRVRRDDLDINGHVNNARYLAWLMEPLPAPPADSGNHLIPAMLDVSFRAECFPGDELNSLCAPAPVSDSMHELIRQEHHLFPHRQSDGYAILHAIHRRQGGKTEESCRALSLWKKSPLNA